MNPTSDPTVTDPGIPTRINPDFARDMTVTFDPQLIDGDLVNEIQDSVVKSMFEDVFDPLAAGGIGIDYTKHTKIYLRSED